MDPQIQTSRQEQRNFSAVGFYHPTRSQSEKNVNEKFPKYMDLVRKLKSLENIKLTIILRAVLLRALGTNP